MPAIPRNVAYSPGYLHQNNGQGLVITSALFIVLDTIFVALRYYARRLTVSGNRTAWEDVVIFLAWLANIGMCVMGIIMVYEAGVGYPVQDDADQGLDRPLFPSRWKCLYALSMLYAPSAVLPKFAVIGFYLRIFTSRGMRLTCYAMAVLLTASWIVTIFAITFACTPVKYQWNRGLTGGSCVNVSPIYISTSAPNLLTDVIILFLPMPTVWQLKLPMMTKFGVMGVFLAGSVGIIASGIRMTILIETVESEDIFGTGVNLFTWTILEPSMYLIAACLMTLRPLFAQLHQRYFKNLVFRRLGRTRKLATVDINQGLKLEESSSDTSNRMLTG